MSTSSKALEYKLIFIKMFLVFLIISFLSSVGNCLGGNTFVNQTNYHFSSTVISESRKSFTNQTTRPFPIVATNMPWDGHFSAQNFQTSADKIALSRIKKSIRTAIVNLPKPHTQILQNLEVKNEANISRGMANREKMIIHTDSISSNNELISVFVHEMGHVVDLGFLVGRKGHASNFLDGKKIILSDDQSLDFYQLSWVNSKTRKPSSIRADFVSGYAMNDVFEDFAESYLFYRIHGEKFRLAMKNSQVLTLKYYFLKNIIFAGVEFQTDKEISFFPNLIFDATLLPFSIRDFLVKKDRIINY
jgi:hypothetical protein